MVAVLSVVTTHTAVITGQMAVLLVDSASSECSCSSRQHPQVVWVHVRVHSLTIRCRRHLLLQVVVSGHGCSLGAQHVRRHVRVAVRVRVEGTVGWRVCRRWGGGVEGGQGGCTVGLVRRLGLGEVTVTAQACELEDMW